MKNVFFFFVTIIMIVVLSSCHSQSGPNGRLAEQREQAKMTAQKDSLAKIEQDKKDFEESLFLTGMIFLNGEEGETSPRISFGFDRNSDRHITMFLLNSYSVEGSGSGIPLGVAMKIRNILMSGFDILDFSFDTTPEGYVALGFSENDKLALDQSLEVLKDIEKAEPKWKITTTKWSVPK